MDILKKNYERLIDEEALEGEWIVNVKTQKRNKPKLSQKAKKQKKPMQSAKTTFSIHKQESSKDKRPSIQSNIIPQLNQWETESVSEFTVKKEHSTNKFTTVQKSEKKGKRKINKMLVDQKKSALLKNKLQEGVQELLIEEVEVGVRRILEEINELNEELKDPRLIIFE